MSRQTYTLKADGRKVRTTAGKTYHVAIAHWQQAERLKVTKRTNSASAAGAEVRRLWRDGVETVFVFHTGTLWRRMERQRHNPA